MAGCARRVGASIRVVDCRPDDWHARRVRPTNGLFAAAVAATVALLSASAALASHALTPERYAALDAAYTALIPLEKDRVPASALAAAQQACNRLGQADALLGPLRRECSTVVDIVRRTITWTRCVSAKGCRRASVRLRRALSNYVRHAQSANRAVDAVVPDPACRLALRTSAHDIRQIKRIPSALRALERALRTGSRADLRRAERRIDAIDEFELTARQERDRFRGACG